VNPDINVYLVALALALASGFLFGMMPVRQVLKANPYQTVKAGPTGHPGRRVTVRDILLVAQILVCAVLVTSALVAVRGMIRSLHSDVGFTPENTLIVNTDLDMADYRGDRAAQMQTHLEQIIAALPGVTAAGVSDNLPLGLNWSTRFFYKDSTTDIKSSTAAGESMIYSVSPGFLPAAGTALLMGRELTLHDDAKAPHVAVVNREFVRRLLGSENKAIGAHFKILGGDRIQIVGVVEDGKYKTLAEEPQPAMFFPILQWPTTSTWIVVRSSRNPHEVATELEATLHNLDPGLPFQIKTWKQGLDGAYFAPRMATVSLGVLGVMGAMLAATGIFGMASYSVSKRLRELGIRIAIGAQRKEVLSAALGRAVRLMAIGSLAGLALGVAASRVLSAVVYQATPRDPLVLGGVVLAMVLLGLLATWIPAARAMRADPMALLRED
jgi:predicted permease